MITRDWENAEIKPDSTYGWNIVDKKTKHVLGNFSDRVTACRFRDREIDKMYRYGYDARDLTLLKNTVVVHSFNIIPGAWVRVHNCENPDVPGERALVFVIEMATDRHGRHELDLHYNNFEILHVIGGIKYPIDPDKEVMKYLKLFKDQLRSFGYRPYWT